MCTRLREAGTIVNELVWEFNDPKFGAGLVFSSHDDEIIDSVVGTSKDD